MLDYKVEAAIRKMFQEGQIKGVPSNWSEEDLIHYISSYGTAITKTEAPEWARRLSNSLDSLIGLAKSGRFKLIQKIPGAGGKLANPKKVPHREEEIEEEKRKGVWVGFTKEELALFGKQDPAEVRMKEEFEELKEKAKVKLERIRELLEIRPHSLEVAPLRQEYRDLKGSLEESKTTKELKQLIIDVKDLERRILSISVKKREKPYPNPKPKPKPLPVQIEEEDFLCGGI